MTILAKVGLAFQQVFGACAQQAAAATGVIRRQRIFTPLSLARTFVLGFLQHPDADDDALARLAAQCGAAVTPQAIAQRQTPTLVRFLRALLTRATQFVVGSPAALAPLVERFTRVVLLDSSTVTLPDSCQAEFPGCGGGAGGGAAAVKLQTELDLRSGAITHLGLEPGRTPDGASPRQQARYGPGALRITDLGYFCLKVFAAAALAGEYFLSRWQFGTLVFLPDGTRLDLLAWLGRQVGQFIDQPVLLGRVDQLACRLIAWRLPQAQADRRRQKLRRDYRDKYGQEPSAARLAWCAWTVLVTNVPLEKLTPAEAAVLYRARWQVELLFKRWKSQGWVAVLSGATEVRQLVRVWARLLAALVQHWLVVAAVWGDPTKSLSKACEAVREFVGRLAALDSLAEVARVLADLGRVVAKTCRRNKRRKAGTFELLNDVSLLDFH
jgi:Transposase DDE domain